MKIQQIDSNAIATLDDAPNYSQQVTLSDGTVAVFRDMTGGDLKFVEDLNGGGIDKTIRLASRLCIKWGNRAGVTVPELEKIRAKDIMRISKALENFLVEPTDTDGVS